MRRDQAQLVPNSELGVMSTLIMIYHALYLLIATSLVGVGIPFS